MIDWNTVLSVALGGIIAIIPVIISNRFQAKEREKERQEQRREEKIQSREKWEERDILRIMEGMDSIIKSVSEVYILSEETEISEINLHQLNRDYRNTNDLIGVLVHSFSPDVNIMSCHLEYMKSLHIFLEKLEKILYAKANNQSYEGIGTQEWEDMLERAGAFQKVLREKIISIRA